jgi:hypothetical protein
MTRSYSGKKLRTRNHGTRYHVIRVLSSPIDSRQFGYCIFWFVRHALFIDCGVPISSISQRRQYFSDSIQLIETIKAYYKLTFSAISLSYNVMFVDGNWIDIHFFFHSNELLTHVVAHFQGTRCLPCVSVYFTVIDIVSVLQFIYHEQRHKHAQSACSPSTGSMSY